MTFQEHFIVWRTLTTTTKGSEGELEREREREKKREREREKELLYPLCVVCLRGVFALLFVLVYYE